MLEKLIEKTNFVDILIVIIASFAMVNFWRGTWHVIDVILFPGNYLVSGICSVAISLIIFFAIAEYRGKSNKSAKKSLKK